MPGASCVSPPFVTRMAALRSHELVLSRMAVAQCRAAASRVPACQRRRARDRSIGARVVPPATLSLAVALARSWGILREEATMTLLLIILLLVMLFGGGGYYGYRGGYYGGGGLGIVGALVVLLLFFALFGGPHW